MPNHKPSFSLFEALPKELRLEIWRYGLPYRVVELGPPRFAHCFGVSFRHDNDIARKNQLPPRISQVCQEARAVAFESGLMQHGLLCHTLNDDYEDNPSWSRTDGKFDVWRASKRSQILLNWTTPSQENIDLGRPNGDPVRYVIHYASHMENAEPAIFSGLLYHGKEDNLDERRTAHPWSKRELAGLLKTRPSWAVVIMRPIFVFAETAGVASGLFGLLGDAPVQLVDADDQERLEAFAALSKVEGVRYSSILTPKGVESAKVRLRRYVVGLWGSLDQAPMMRPVIMFRLYQHNVHVNKAKASISGASEPFDPEGQYIGPTALRPRTAR